jgi:hypothetical protein
MKLNMPAPLVLILAVAAGVLEYLNQQTFQLGNTWYECLKYGLLIIGLIGVVPAVGAQIRQDFTAVFHVSPVFYTVVGVAVAAVTGAITTFNISGVLAGVLLGVVAFLTYAGFAQVPAGTVRPA